jgi:phage shock protein C
MDKKLYRSSKDKMISGVCGGIAEYFNIDPTLVRIGVVILGFASFFTFFFGYIICAIVMPEKPYDEEEEDVEVYDKDGNKIHTQKKNSNIIGFSLIGIGCIWILNKLVWWVDHDIYVGLGIIIIGIIVLLTSMNRKNEASK